MFLLVAFVALGSVVAKPSSVRWYVELVVEPPRHYPRFLIGRNGKVWRLAAAESSMG